ncbi:MAG: glutamate-ammonia-ligase adenylyltransferase [Caulobacter sp.]|nr:glutamate-ammonia-ligase adenylyltransferase [Caulobacter sp.]
MTPLADRLAPCGPVLDAKAADRALETLTAALPDQGALIARAWPVLAPVFGASPYLASLARRRPKALAQTLASDPDERLEGLIAAARALGGEPDPETVRRVLREQKTDIHLLTALADLGGVWDLDAVTGALSRFADAAVFAALALAARQEVERGRLMATDPYGPHGPIPGLICLAMGKHGAFELNYSSDIDLTLFYEPEALPLTEGTEAQNTAVRLSQTLAQTLQDRTGDGYVFRVDLRLRPDPSSTPPAMPLAAAFAYYETVGQNWERAAFIKARAAGGDIPRGEEFLEELSAFIWRRHLDFAAIADIHSIKRQIHAYKVDERLSAKGADLKLGRGGIREIEFFVQTQQLILGGRHPELRSNRTLDALAALSDAGQVDADAARDMAGAYVVLRGLEHRAQMVADDQTHKLPESDAERKRIAALAGEGNLKTFDAGVERTLRTVNARYGKLFAGEEALSSKFGSLVFTGVDDDPETLKTLGKMGFSAPARVAQTIRNWHHGRISATRTERGRELFTRLAPRLLDAIQASGAPDTAFNRFADFFAGLSSGVQVQSLFLAQPRLLELVVEVMAFAPELARTLARRPAALDALLDPAFFAPFETGQGRASFQAAMAAALEEEAPFEASMDAARRAHREQAFRVGVQVISGTASAEQAGGAFAELADLCIESLAAAALGEVERMGAAFAGEVAVVALGKCGSREMTARSDLDLMTLYRPSAPDAASAVKAWPAEVFYGRFTQRLTAALSAPTGEGGLYEVDLKLRPTGSKGPVAVSFPAFERYYAGEAETWEYLAMTRARVAWATSEGFARECAEALRAVLRRPREAAAIAADVREMRELMARERPPHGFWDMKLSDGGLVDVEFAAQHLQLIHAGTGGPLAQNTGEALAAMAKAGLADAGAVRALEEAWRLQQNLSQLLKVALDDKADPAEEPPAFRALLARAGGAKDFKALKAKIEAARAAAHGAYLKVVG